MPSVPDPDHVKPWYLRNITEALALDDASGNVFVRTGFQGNIIISGNVNIPGTITVDSTPEDPVHNHISEVGTSGILDVPYLPIGGNVIINSGNVDANVHGNVGILTMPNVNASVTGNVVVSSGNINANVTQGTSPWVVSGNINSNVSGTVELGATTLSALENTTVTISGTPTVNIGTIPEVEIKNDSGNPIPVTGIVTAIPDLSVGDFYGEPYAIPLHPLIQFNGHDGILTNDIQTYTALSGSTTVVDGVFNVACSTTAGSYGVLRSRRFAVHRAGQSNVARFLALFDTPASSTQQMIGMQNQESSFYIGFNGTQFGVQHTHSGRAAVYSLKINSYTGNQTVTLTLNSTVYTISIATGETVNKAAQRIAAAITDGLWLANQIDDTVYFLSSTNGDKTGTFSVSGSGNLNATLTRQAQGVANTIEWFYEGVDFTLPSAINLSHYNEWQIKYDWVGITFFVLNVSTNQFELFYRHVHNTLLEVKSASFKVAAVCYNTGGSNAITLKAASMMAALEGEEVFNGFPHSISNTQATLAANTYWHLVTLQNPYVFNNKINTRQSRLLNMTVAAESGDPVQIMLVMDPVLTTAIYDFKSQNGFMISYDAATEAAVTMTSNYPVLTMACPKTGGQIYELRDYNIVIPPGTKLAIVAYGTASISRITSAINWIDK